MTRVIVALLNEVEHSGTFTVPSQEYAGVRH